LCLLVAVCQKAGVPPTDTPEAAMTFSLESSAFDPGGVIPRQYSCDGADQSPPLSWRELPQGSRSLAFIVEDPDAPGGTFTHWVLFNVPPDAPALPAGVPKQADLPDGARQGRNDFRRVGYGGPCPLRGSSHHYIFHGYALDTTLGVTAGAAASEVRAAARGHILAEAQLVGTYGRQ
jgi:Raf kinase inhibitor-like YbhB/YbcL family protein